LSPPPLKTFVSFDDALRFDGSERRPVRSSLKRENSAVFERFV
jgi:hypothetical protein